MSDFCSSAVTAKNSARLLLDAGDASGAANRAYYAMYDAARAALIAVDASLDNAKTHQTVIRRFGLHVVVNGGLDPELARPLSGTETLRIVADCRPTPLDRASAEHMIESMDRFLDAVEQCLKSRGTP